MIKILIVEDDNNINGLIAKSLSKNNYFCIQAYSGTEAYHHVKNQSFDLLILDLMLPGMNGDELIKKIHDINVAPIIIVSAKDELDSKVDLLMLGADDYVTKPFEIDELMARVAVQLRKNNNSQQSVLKHRELVLDRNLHKISIKGLTVELTRQEFLIIELLLMHPKQVFSKQDIYNYAWSDYYIGEDSTINVHISNIRQKFKQVTEEEYIETVWGIGFKLK